MNHVAIDLGSTESQVCIRRPDGTIESEKKHRTARLGELMKTWAPSRVILETSSETFKIADAAKAAGHEVIVVSATLVRQLGVGERGIKTDERDARKLSEVSCRITLPSVFVPTEKARELRRVMGTREVLIASRTRLVNHVRGWLRQQIWKLPTGASASFPDRVRARAKKENLEVAPAIESVLVTIQGLNDQLKAIDKLVAAEARANPVCRRLMTTPGVGPLTAVHFVALIDDPSRFPNAHRLQSYLGLTPGEKSSSEKQRRTGITKAGSSSFRRVITQAAWAAFIRRPNDPMVRWAKQIERRRGKFVAIIALARKLTGVLFALWRDNSEYRIRIEASA